MFFTALDTFRILSNTKLCLFRYIQEYISTFSIIKTYSRILMFFKAYSCIFKTLSNPRMFTTLPYSKPWHLELEVCSKLDETLTRHIQILTIVRTVSPSIIQPFSDIFQTLCNTYIFRKKPGIFEILEYSEPFYN